MANKKKRDTIAKSRVSEGKYLTKSSVSDGVFWFRSENYFATFSFFDKESKSLINPQIYYVAPNSLLSDVYQVKRARFLKDQEWQLEEGIHLHQLDNEGFPKTETIQQTAIKLRETPSDFYEFESDLTTLDFFQLKQFLDKMSKTGMNIREYQVLLMKKLALAMVCGIFALIPLSTIFNPNRRSASFGKNVAFALVFTIIFWVLFSFTLSFGEKGTWTPLLSAFVLPLGCLLFILWGFIQHRKLSF